MFIWLFILFSKNKIYLFEELKCIFKSPNIFIEFIGFQNISRNLDIFQY